MALNTYLLNTFAANIKDLSDTPNDDGITAAQLKALFDGRTDNEIKTSINGIINTLLAKTDGSSGADNIGATAVGSDTEATRTTVQAILEALDGAVSGMGFSINSIGEDLLNVVDTSTAQTVHGVKTFSDSPVVPTPTTDMQASTKKYVDDGLGAGVTLGGFGTLINGATAKTTPIDADLIPIIDSAASNLTKKLSWANIKALLVPFTGAASNLDLGIHELIATGIASKGGAIFTGSISPIPTTYGNYITLYLSGTYGLRLVGYNGTSYQDVHLGAMPTVGKFGLNLLANGNVTSDYNITAANFGAASGVATLDSDTKIVAAQSSAKIISVSASATLALIQAGAQLRCTNSSAIILTVPLNSAVSFPVGTEIEIYRAGAGTVTIAFASGITVECSAATYTVLSQYTSVVLKKEATDTWNLQGNVG